jgi:hypothetical protein
MLSKLQLRELHAVRSQLKEVLEHLDEVIAPNPIQQQRGVLTDTQLRTLPRTEAIEEILRRSDGPMRPIEIWEALRTAGRRNDPKMEVQVTTFDLWRRARIGKIGRGQYVTK